MKITIVGTGYVGLVSAVGLAELGHRVFCVDTDPQKIEILKSGRATFYEPGLDKLLKKNLANRRLSFTVSLAQVIDQSEIIFICVGTPPQPDGSADLTYVKQVAASIQTLSKQGKIVVTKSTVPIGTGAMLEQILNKKPGRVFEAVSCPEFLREGQAVYDFFHPDRIVVGADKQSVGFKVINLFSAVKTHKMVTSRETAELIKYAANAFLATKISFINEISNVCEKTGADVEEVAKGMGLDKRINPYFLKAGIGYGGSCFPKDVRALRQLSGGNGYNFRLLKAVIEVNNKQRQLFFEKIKKVLGSLEGKKIGVLGLAFKGNTDDVRESAAVDLIKKLVKAKAKVSCFDPQAVANARLVLNGRIRYCANAYETMEQADALIIATEWPQFAKLDFKKVKKLLRQPIIFDGKNLLNHQLIKKAGFSYYSVGRS
ncbi:MAG: UDP-glucose/GDP-mannose dehydrogenase family protein [Candidatus Komeilibacteria bacterium]|nr:UDP-glucose/GDP-mannose dehydrogenase family protein [Candidatus Komeilibacteria bacterium]